MVYLIYDKVNKLTKIGESINPKKRYLELKIANPNLTLSFYTNKYEEKELHDKYAKLRVVGEWFNLGMDEYYEIIGSKKGLPKSMYYSNFKKITQPKNANVLEIIKGALFTKWVCYGGLVGITKDGEYYDLENGIKLNLEYHNGAIYYRAFGSKTRYSWKKCNDTKVKKVVEIIQMPF